MTMIPRQAAMQQQVKSTASHYDHRWLLFLIPIFLLFIALIFTVWYLLRRRKKQKQRRSVLRNRALVVAEQEKQREKEQRRLSRGNSLSSRLSRMTSTKSATSRIARPVTTTSQSALEVEEMGATSIQGQGNLQGEGAAYQSAGVDQKMDSDIEQIAESSVTIPLAVSISESNNRVKIGEEAKPLRLKRKEVDGMIEIPSQQTTSLSANPSLIREVCSTDYNGWTIDRQDSQKSIGGGMNSSLSHGTQSSGGNPFTTPSTSSAGHELLYAQVSEEKGGNESKGGTTLARKLSGMARLRQPSPVTSSRNVQRSESRASRKSSTRSTHTADLHSPRSASAASLAASNWTYTPQAAKWKSSSTEVSPPPNEHLAEDKISASNDIGELDQKTSTTVAEGQSSLSSKVDQLSRKPSTGVAGSKFVESFDDE